MAPVLAVLACGAASRGLSAGLDFGTSGVRIAVAEAAAGDRSQAPSVVFSAKQPLQGGGGPADWLSALDGLFGAVPADIKSQLAHVGVSGTSATSLVVDRGAREGVERPVTRGPRRYDLSVLREPCGAEALERIAAWAPEGHTVRAPTSSLAKLVAWTLEEPLGPTEAFCHQSDFVVATLTGQWAPVASDWHNALKLGFDVADGALRYPDWMDGLLGSLPGDRRPDLPEVRMPGEQVGHACAAACARWGLPTKTCAVHAGTTDSIAAFIAATGGLAPPGSAVTSLGSTLAIKLVSTTKVDDVASGVYSHRLGAHFLVGGASNCGCAALAERFSPEDLARLSEEIDPEQDMDLGYVPMAAGTVGERFPRPDPEARQRLAPQPESDSAFLHGAFYALAALEADAFRTLESLGASRVEAILSCGGGAQNPVLTRMRERLISESGPVRMLQAAEGEASYGAAVLALRAGEFGGDGGGGGSASYEVRPLGS